MKKIFQKILIISVMSLAFGLFCGLNTTKAGAKTYTISPKSKPCNNWHINKHNKHYIVIRSYMIKLEKKKGGTLVLKKGTYKISNTIYVPSNVTIKFKDGVKLVKHSKTGTKDYVAASSMFQLVRDSKSKKKNVTKKHNGEKNIQFIGEGNVVLNMKNYNKGNAPALAIAMGNNRNVKVENIKFKNIKYGHFIEMDGCKNVSIQNCSFSDMADNKYHNKEAINLDTNDPKRDGFGSQWCTKDSTPNEDVTITNCRFDNMVRAVGTHRYSDGKYHNNIRFTDNSVTNSDSALGILNWSNSVVTGNTITNCKGNSKYDYVVLVAGTSNLTLKDNVFTNCSCGDVLLRLYTRYDAGQSIYPMTKNNLSAQNMADLEQNQFVNCKSPQGYWREVTVAK